jgi:hypothetical protein
MQLLSVLNARAVWILPLLDLNPRGRAIGSDLIDWLKKTYDFKKYPSSVVDVDQSQALVFSSGTFEFVDESGNDNRIAVDLSIFNDGLVANTRSATKDADRFIEQGLKSAVSMFDLEYTPTMVRQKLYLSEVDVKLDRPLSSINPNLQKLGDKISTLLNGTSFEVSNIEFARDPRAPWQHASFKVERRLNVPLSENRYFCVAPLHTEDHLQLLSEFEQFLQRTV